MASEWSAIALGDVCTKIGSGATPRGGQSVYLEQGDYALIRSQNIYNDGFHHEGLAYITEEHAEQLSNVELEPNDVLLNITGDSVARCCQVDNEVLPARVNQHVAVIRPVPNLLDPRFLRYFLISPLMQSKMLSWAGSGATRNALTKGMIESFTIPAPNIDEQRAIAAVLGSLDDKIELNRRMNATLEGLARALFQAWIVDFEPVRAKMEGRPTGLPAEIEALFPEALEVGAEGVERPRGWKPCTVGDVVELVRMPINPGAHPGEPYWHYSLPAFDEGQFPRKEQGHTIKSTKQLIPRRCVLLSKLNPRFPKVWIPFQLDEVRAIASTEFLIASPKGPYSLEYVYLLFGSDDFLRTFSGLVTGTSSSHQRVKSDHFLEMKIMPAPESVIEQFTLLVKPLLEKAKANRLESRTLAALRDALLPRLMSGEVRVPVAEQAVADAL